MTIATPVISITADEVNCLIHAYLEDSGFIHSAFCLRTEGRLDQTPLYRKHIPRGELVDLLSKALLYTEVQAHWRGDTLTSNCVAPFSILDHHTCSLDSALSSKPTRLPPVPSKADSVPPHPEKDSIFRTTNGVSEKRKAPESISDEARTDKRAKVDMQPDSKAMESACSSPVGTITAAQSASRQAPSAQIPPASGSSLNGNGGGLVSTQKLEPPPDQPGSVRLLSGHTSEVFVCAWNPVQKDIVASGSRDGMIYLWRAPGPDPVTGSVPADQEPLRVQCYNSEEPIRGTGPMSGRDLTALDWSPDGQLLAVGSLDRVLRIVTVTGEIYFSHAQHQKGPVFATRFSKSGKWLLTSSLDGTACVWDVQQKKLHRQFRCHIAVWTLNDLDMFATCGADKLIHIMRLNEQRPIKTLTGHTDEINQVRVNESGTRLASCSDDRTARIWNVESIIHSSSESNEINTSTGTKTDSFITLRGHKNKVSIIRWCPRHTPGESELVVTSGFDGTARIWDSTSGVCLRTFSEHQKPIYALEVSPDGRWMSTGGGDCRLCFYSLEKIAERKWVWQRPFERKRGVFEISWQQGDGVNRIAVALESREVGLVDLNRVGALQAP
ncbi:WD40 repeat-like protein [Punctularia strigosozonata HHB-11173 SS5]|uniref:WD40 repeat-like protein n=1 Tax=Punctularia strigosozonata (strain HHB-11173) TaxID=741275 RepID=UPI0004416944|nr:WD40 repeat-like protein [Punctularia strigosozonata HHB-11173 SS5]EIN13834.1 WD40 repeat-like protein [Punctularia strigosozonata HHB-11173 SS5]